MPSVVICYLMVLRHEWFTWSFLKLHCASCLYWSAGAFLWLFFCINLIKPSRFWSSSGLKSFVSWTRQLLVLHSFSILAINFSKFLKSSLYTSKWEWSFVDRLLFGNCSIVFPFSISQWFIFCYDIRNLKLRVNFENSLYIRLSKNQNALTEQF